jgi:hypothetical protein
MFLPALLISTRVGAELHLDSAARYYLPVLSWSPSGRQVVRSPNNCLGNNLLDSHSYYNRVWSFGYCLWSHLFELLVGNME